MCFKLLQCSVLAASVHVGPFYCLVSTVSQFCLGSCNMYSCPVLFYVLFYPLALLIVKHILSPYTVYILSLFSYHICVYSCATAAQGEAGEAASAGGTVVQSSRSFPHAFCLDSHSPSQHCQQCGRSGSVRPGL